MIRSLKPKRCRICARDFTPISSMSKVCSVPCSLEWARKLAEKKAAQDARTARVSAREARERAKTRGEHLRELQTAFNAWIRKRDEGEKCISCERPASWRGQWDAGHYRAVGSAPELRFEPLNVHRQCGPCNVHLSGNLIPYRRNLIAKIGLTAIEWLEGPHEPKKLSVADIKEMKAYYRAEVRRMKRGG